MANCQRCNDTGELPFYRADGSVVPHVKVFCKCQDVHQDDRYYPIKPEDIDFPVSYDYWRHLSQYHGWPDPGNQDIKEVVPEKQEIIHKTIQYNIPDNKLRALKTILKPKVKKQQTEDITDRLYPGAR